MKTTLLFLLFAFFLNFDSSAQDSENYKVTQLIAGGGKNFQIIGSGSDSFVDSLFSHFPKTKRKGYIWKFKNVQVPGIESPLTLQVHQGLYGTKEKTKNDTTLCKSGCYFNTFTSEKYKQTRLNQKISTEQNAIILYVKRGRNNCIKTAEEAEFVKEFLLLMYES